MHVSLRDRQLGQRLRQLSNRYNNRYSTDARGALLRILFRHLANDDDAYLRLFFPNWTTFPENQHWSLSEAQGAFDGAEYSTSARGRRCGHIFKSGEATYSCRTCTTDETCVLCTRCFEASDHDGHQVYVSLSGGSSGCCDCEDPEAWVRPVKCSIHTALPANSASEPISRQTSSPLPSELQESIRITISRAFDFICDTLSCCPEKMTPPKSESAIRQDEEKSRLTERLYGGLDQREREFALILWNDEKHTVDDVAEVVARACRKSMSYGFAKAHEVDEVGRSVLSYSTNLEELLRQARILAKIEVTITIRSSRDTFREEMCGTMIQWLSDIAGCSVDTDHHILMNVICEEMLKSWRIGSEAFNLAIAKHGIMDHQKSEQESGDRMVLSRQRQMINRQRTRLAQLQVRRAATLAQRIDPEGENINAEDVDEDITDDFEGNQEDENLVNVDDGMDIDEPFVEHDDEMAGNNNIINEADDFENIGVIGITSSISFRHDPTSDTSDVEMPPLVSENDSNKLFTEIPLTPKQKYRPTTKVPAYWVKKRFTSLDEEDHTALPPHEDLSRRIRIDHLILYDLRLWKQFRTDLKHLYISTVVTIPGFKRILSLRFAALYTHLAQLYLVADREPDHSIINLSLQMLTTPSITAEVVKRGDFLTRLLAILYTFLTKLQVGNPEDVDVTAVMAFDAGVMKNRRIYHFFSDMKYLLDAPYVMDRIRSEQEYLLQFLDFAKLYQGICPNTRAIGEHIEYESDSWITASFIVRDVTRMSRQFCESFRWTRSQDPASICRAIRQTAKIATINSLGLERSRFVQSELKQETRYKKLSFNGIDELQNVASSEVYTVVEFDVETGCLSFHHALHYTLSWLIECGKSMSRDQLLHLLSFSPEQLPTPDPRDSSNQTTYQFVKEDYLLALFDIPLRVCAWLAQMKAGMWVRNGITLRHQMSTYRGVGQRDVSHQRDLFLLQVAFAVCQPAMFLAGTIDRFGMSDWVRGRFVVKQGYDDHQMIDVAEEYVHLLIVLLSERTLLFPNEEEEANSSITSARRDIVHVLCFKPLTFSELTVRLSDKVQELPNLQEVLQDVTTYRAPEGLADSGLLQLKRQFFKDIDPYHAYYSKSQREEAENIYRSYVSEQSGKAKEDVFFVPELRPIKNGVFTTFSDFTRTALFMQVVYAFLRYVHTSETCTPQIPSGRLEAFLQTVLHLALIAALDERVNIPLTRDSTGSFIDFSLHGAPGVPCENGDTILNMLFRLVRANRFTSSKYRIRFLLRQFRDNNPYAFEAALAQHRLSEEWGSLLGTSPSSAADDVALKKKQAIERQAKVLADFAVQQNQFLQNQPIDWGMEEGDDSDNEMAEATEMETWAFPTGTCIFCQEEMKDQQLYGTLGYLAESRIFRTTDLRDLDYVAEVYSVPCDLDRAADNIRPFGVAGQNVQQITKANPRGHVIRTERKGLGKGFPVSQHSHGPVVTGCGHLMHYSCFQTYDEATTRRHQYQVARMHPEDIHLNEFVCPLCKALGNVFLPIVWKAKPVTEMFLPDSDSFAEWLSNQIRDVGTKSSSREFPTSIYGEPLSQSSESFLQRYASNAFNSQLAAALSTEYRASIDNSVEVTIHSGSRFRIPSFLRFDHQANPIRERPESDLTPRSSLISELEKAYQRIVDTMRQNRLPTGSVANSIPGELTHADVLAKALGNSITAIEIGQRGIEAAAECFIGSIPEQTSTHLKVLSETISSYVALDGLHPWTRNMPKFFEISRLQAHQLFRQNEPLGDGSVADVRPLFTEDLFCFLAECTVFLIPTFGLESYQVLRLCYTAELVKVVVSILYEPTAVWNYARSENPLESDKYSPEQSQRFSAFVEDILIQSRQAASQGGTNLPQFWQDIDPSARYRFDTLLHILVEKYALAFLRKAALLLHVRYSIKFGTDMTGLQQGCNPGASPPELLRISLMLGLPDLEELIKSFIGPHPHSTLLHHLTSTWIKNWSIINRHQLSSAPKNDSRLRTRLQVAHPSIYELVSLPSTHDTLNGEALSRRCPSTGGDLSDPSICLLCGAFVCSQSRCCTVENPATEQKEGGCFRHRKSCGGSIGMFLNIRKCAVLCLYENRGSFFTAPYLDKHGEIDMSLRRKNQLFLNQRRYDKLFRDMWLNHQIPSAVARKLEAEINIGGWETI